MVILICIPCLLTGGTEIQTLNLIKALVQGGYRVVTACYFEHSDDMVERYRQAGSEVELFHAEGKRIGGWRGILFLYSHLKRCVKKYRPHAAHVQYMAPGAQPVFILKALGVRKILATVHTNSDIYRNLNLLHFVQKHLLDVFLCITKRAEEGFFGTSRLYEWNLSLEKRNHFTIYNALPPPFECRAGIRHFSLPATIGVVGSLEKIKGMDRVLPAFAALCGSFPHSRLVVVGDGSLRAEMEEQACQLGVQEKVTWMGKMKREKLPELYDGMDILWIPSRSEGFGLSALEGMSRGCVVVAADTGGLPEVVRDGKTGLLHHRDSIDDLVLKTASLLENEKWLCDLSRQAVEAAGEFGWERFQKLINDLYRKVL